MIERLAASVAPNSWHLSRPCTTSKISGNLSVRLFGYLPSEGQRSPAIAFWPTCQRKDNRVVKSIYSLVSSHHTGSGSLSESGLGPPLISHWSFLCLLRSSFAFSWLRVSFFFLGGPAPLAGVDAPSGVPSSPLPAGVPAFDPDGVMAGLARLDARREAGFDFASKKASSTTALFPCCTNRPFSTFQISGPKTTLSWRKPRHENGSNTYTTH